MAFFDSLYLNNCFLWDSGSLKIRLLQCYVVLWIHNIDTICMLGAHVKDGKVSFMVATESGKDAYGVC